MAPEMIGSEGVDGNVVIGSGIFGMVGSRM